MSIRPSAASSGSSMPMCAHLMNFPDAPPPAGLRLVPEVATGYPRVSRDGKTYTFTLRSGFRFSDGTPVQASAFAHAIERLIAPGDRLVRRAVRAEHRRRCRSSTRARRRRLPGSSRPGTVSPSGSRNRLPISPRDHDDAVLLRRPADTSRPTPRASTPSPARARTPSRSSFAAAASCWNGIGSTGERGHTTWIASSSTSRRSLPLRRSAGSSKARPTGASSSRRPSTTSRAVGLVRKYGVNRSQFFVTPGTRLARVLPERHATAVPRQSRAAPGRELRGRPARDRAPGRPGELSLRPADRPVPAAEHAGVPGCEHLPARRARPRESASPGPRPYAKREGSPRYSQLPGPARSRAGRSSRTWRRSASTSRSRRWRPGRSSAQAATPDDSLGHHVRQLGGRLHRSVRSTSARSSTARVRRRQQPRPPRLRRSTTP